MNVANYSQDFESVCINLKMNATKKLATKLPKKTHEFRIFNEKKIKGAEFYGTSSNGDELIRNIRKMLTKLPIKLSEQQKIFTEEFTRACAPGLYRETWDTNYQRVLKQNKWQDPKPNTMIITPRRFGKTTVCAAYVAVYALCVPGGVQAIFSTSKRVSTMFLQQVKKFLLALTDLTGKILTSNQEELWIQGNSQNDIRKISSYPGRAEVTLVWDWLKTPKPN